MKIKKSLSGIAGILFLFAIFLAIVSTSGCIRAKECPLVVSQTDGVVVTRLQPSYNLIPVGDQVTLTAEIQNRGNALAENVRAYVWSKPGFAIEGKTDIEANTLNPPRLDICSSGDAKPLQWRLTAGCDPRESVLAIAVEYDYTSDGWASIFLVSDVEAERAAGKFKEKGENKPSAGPIQVLLEPLQNEPIIISEESPNFDVRAKIKDLGKGVVGKEGNGKVSEIKITTSGPCVFTQLNKDSYGDERTLIFNDEARRNAVTLSIGKEEAFRILKLQYNGGFPFTKDFCRINVHADYHYREIEAVKEKMGITGTSSQVAECRALNATSQ